MRSTTPVLTTAILAMIGVGGFGTPLRASNYPPVPLAEKQEDRPIHEAHRSLLMARHALDHAAHEFAGHRTKAHQATEDALQQVDQALGRRWENDKLTDSQKSEVEEQFRKRGDDPRGVMEIGLDHLQTAKAQLTAAAHDYEGHRARAVELVEKAIHEVHAGLASEKQ